MLALREDLRMTDAFGLDMREYPRLTGQEEAEQEQKGAGRHVFAGSLLGGQLTLGAVANRCDCILNPITTAEKLTDDFVPSVGRWPTPFAGFQAVTETYLRALRFPVNRMAFAATLVSPHRMQLDAYKALVTQVKSLNRPPEDLHDVLFRINWPKNSTVDNSITINRITAWAVQQLQLQILVPDGSGPGTYVNDLTYVLRFELDHNTDQRKTTPFDAARLLPIYKELTNLALQNADEGEVL